MALNTNWNDGGMGPGTRGGAVDGKFYYDKQSYLDAKARQSYTQQQGAQQAAANQVKSVQSTTQIANRPKYEGRYDQLWGQSQNRPESSFRGGQETLAGVLQDRAQGKNLLSTELLRQGADRNIKQQMAMAASARPGQVGMAQRMAAQNAGSINAGLAGQQTIAGLQEQMQNQALLSNVLGQGRGQDLQSQGLRDQLAMGATGAQVGMSQAEMQAALGRYGIDTNAATSIKLGEMQRPSTLDKILGFGLGGLGAYATGGGFRSNPETPPPQGVQNNAQISGVLNTPPPSRTPYDPWAGVA